MSAAGERFEEELKQLASAQLRARLSSLQAQIITWWVATAGGLDRPLPPQAQRELRTMLDANIRRLRPGDLAPAIRRLLPRGLLLGSGRAGGGGPLRVSRELNQAAGRVDRAVSRSLTRARALAGNARVDTWSQVQAILAQVTRGANEAEAIAVWAAHRAVNDGVRVAADTGTVQPVIWVPERDACLTCLAYAGMVAVPGATFPAGRTLGDSSSVKHPIPGPPAHPWCRCELELLPPGAGPDNPQSQALRREAQRTVLQGKALGSKPAGIRAANKLLAQAGGLLVPKSVVARARERVGSR